MRIRTIKPEFWQSEDLARCSDKARLLAVGLLNYADDEGFFNANPALIQAAIFPFDPSSNITGMLQELSVKAKYVAFGEAEGKKYGVVVNFLEHQVISHPKASKIKALCKFQYHSSNVPVTFHPEGKGMEGKGMEVEEEREGTLAWAVKAVIAVDENYSRIPRVGFENAVKACPPGQLEKLVFDWEQDHINRNPSADPIRNPVTYLQRFVSNLTKPGASVKPGQPVVRRRVVPYTTEMSPEAIARDLERAEKA